MNNYLSDWKSGAAIATAVAVGAYTVHRSRSRTETPVTKLRGPPRDNLIMGQTKAILGAPGARKVLEEWADEYGGMFFRPGPFGSGDICVTDPKAVAHILGSSQVWHVSAPSRVFIEKHLGRGLLTADGDDHKRQRRVISPGFSSIKIKEYAEIFRDCTEKLITHWDNELMTSGEKPIDVNKWFTAYTLDTIGIAGFGHDFRALEGQPSAVGTAFEGIGNNPIGLVDIVMVALQNVFVSLGDLPSAHWKAVKDLYRACSHLARDLLERDPEVEKSSKSIMGLMIRAESASSGAAMTEDEVTTQIRTLLVAGYETTSATLTSALIELCRHPEVQARLHDELEEAFPGADPTYDDLMGGLPFLDAFLHETLRLHSPVPGGWRTAQCDDIIPLLSPITLANGAKADRVVVQKGATITVEVEVINHSRTVWGPDAWEFRPERWLEPLPECAQAIAGYHHLVTFGDGPKVCLGRSFAIANLKTLLSALIRRYTFELPDGQDTKIVEKFTLVVRPAVEGQAGFAIPMKIKRIDEA